MPHRGDCGEGFVPPACAKKEVPAAFGVPVTNKRSCAGREPSRGVAYVGTRITALREIQGRSTAPRIPDAVLVRSRKREAEAGIHLPPGASAPAAGRSRSSESSVASDRQHSTDTGKTDAMAHDSR